MPIKSKLKVGILAFLFIAVMMWIWLAFCMVREGGNISRTPLAAYNNLFNKESQAQLQQPYVFKSKIREPASNYNIDDDFHLTVNRLILKNNKPLQHLLKVQNTEVNRSYEPYSFYADNSGLTMTETYDGVGTIDNVNFKYQGNLQTISKNDSLICYYLKFTTFSLSYDDNRDNDIWAKSNSPNDVNLNIAFIKKNKYLYEVLLFKNQNETTDFSPDRLYKMLNK